MQRRNFFGCCPPIITSGEKAVGDVSGGGEGTIWEPRGALGMDFRKLIPSLDASPQLWAAVEDNHPQVMEVTSLSEFKVF